MVQLGSQTLKRSCFGVLMLAGSSPLRNKNNPGTQLTTVHHTWTLSDSFDRRNRVKSYFISHRCYTLLSICALCCSGPGTFYHTTVSGRWNELLVFQLKKKKKAWEREGKKRSLNSSIISVWPNCQTLFWQNEAGELPTASSSKVKEAEREIVFFFVIFVICLTMKPGLISPTSFCCLAEAATLKRGQEGCGCSASTRSERRRQLTMSKWFSKTCFIRKPSDLLSRRASDGLKSSGRPCKVASGPSGWIWPVCAKKKKQRKPTNPSTCSHTDWSEKTWTCTF